MSSSDFVIESGALKVYNGPGGNVTIPTSVTEIGQRAFSFCHSMTSVAIPESVTCIGNNAFEGCSGLTSVTIPKSVTSIGNNAFEGCGSLMEIRVSGESLAYRSMGGVLFDKDAETLICCPMGKTGEYIIPAGVTNIGNNAFHGCHNITRVTFPRGIVSIRNNAFEDCSSLTSVMIPEGVTDIGNLAFSGCSAMTSVAIPNSVANIGKMAFHSCCRLTSAMIPEGITDVEEMVFCGCHSLTSVTIPEGVTRIGEMAFCSCSSLTSVTIPNSVTSIEKNAFAGCSSLTTVTLTNTIETLSPTVFSNTCIQRIIIPETADLRSKKLPISLCSRKIEWTQTQLAEIVLYQKHKNWQDWLRTSVKKPESVFSQILTLLGKENSVDSAIGNRAIRFVKDFGEKLDNCAVHSLITLLAEKGCPAVDGLEKDEQLQAILRAEKAQEYQVETFAEKINLERGTEQLAEKFVSTDVSVYYVNSSVKCSRKPLVCLLTESVREWDRCSSFAQGDYGEISFLRDAKLVHLSKIADQVAAALDRRSLSAFLEEQVGGNYYRYSLLAFARYADDRGIENVCSNYKALSRGRAKERYKANNLKEALLLSDTRAAMLFFDQIGELDRYAALHNMSAVDMRDSVMLPDFALDEDGKKRYDIGGNIVEVGFSPELELTLYDVNKGKVVRSFPKKSDDPAKAEAAAKEFAAFKKDITDFLKLRTEQLHKMHLSGDTVKPELWHKVYVEHPVIRLLSQLVIWMDESKHTFTVLDAETVDSELRPYTPQGSIHVAHVLEMNAADIAAWQEMLRGQKKKQLFEQVWEPIIPWEAKELKTKYEDVSILPRERNELKKRLKQRGVDVRSADMDREYDPYSGKYEFSGESTMLFGSCLTIDYSSDGEEIVFGRANVKAEQGNREINAVLFELDRLMTAEHIREDRSETLSESLLSTFTVAQISEFIELSVASEATASTAVLLNYKNKHYSDYVDMNDFSLDW